MPYKYVTYKNGFTEIIPVNLTVAEEAAQMARMNGVKIIPFSQLPIGFKCGK